MATIKDIARLSGLSKTTVSEVLGNGRRPVHAATRQRVLEAAQQLEYRPNALARGLVGKRMNTVGVVFSYPEAPQISQFELGALLGILSLNGQRKQSTMILNVDYGQWEERVPELCDGRCDGLLLMVPPEDSALPQALLRLKVPCVLLSARDISGQAPSVDVDNMRASSAMIRALLEMGHRRIAYVLDPNIHESISGFARERHEGYREALSAAGALDPALDGLTWEAAVALAARSEERPTAFFCSHDSLALLLMEQLMRAGVRVPDDVSVAGFDDIPAASTSRPALSTVRQPIHQLGESAAAMLLSMIDGTITPGHRELLPTEIILRESTAPPST